MPGGFAGLVLGLLLEEGLVFCLFLGVQLVVEVVVFVYFVLFFELGGEDGAVFGDDDVLDGVALFFGKLADVGGGDLEGVEDGGGALGVKAVLAERGEDHGERQLDGVGVFQHGQVELEGRAHVGEVVGEERLAEELFAGDGEGVDHVLCAVVRRAERAEMGVDGLVVIAEGAVAQGKGAATGSVAADVTADGDGHDVSPPGGYPPPPLPQPMLR